MPPAASRADPHVHDGRPRRGPPAVIPAVIPAQEELLVDHGFHDAVIDVSAESSWYKWHFGEPIVRPHQLVGPFFNSSPDRPRPGLRRTRARLQRTFRPLPPRRGSRRRRRREPVGPPRRRSQARSGSLDRRAGREHGAAFNSPGVAREVVQQRPAPALHRRRSRFGRRLSAAFCSALATRRAAARCLGRS